MLKKLLIFLLCAVQLVAPAALIATHEFRSAQLMENGKEYIFDLSTVSYQRGFYSHGNDFEIDPIVYFTIKGDEKFFDSDDKQYIFTDKNGVSLVSDSCPKGYAPTGDWLYAVFDKSVAVTQNFETLFPDKEYEINYVFLENGVPDDYNDYDVFTDDSKDGFWINKSFVLVYAVGTVYDGEVIFTDLLVDGKSFARLPE